jgi:membrane protein
MNKERLNYSLQDIYNLTNTIIPALTVLSILVGGLASFVYLNSLGARQLLLDFSVQEFTIIFIAYFIYVAYFYLFMYSSSISYHIFLNKYKCSKNAKSILKKYFMLSILILLYILTENNPNLYIKVIVSLILILTFFYFLIRKLKGVGYIRNNLVKHIIFTFLLALDLSPLLFIFFVTIFKNSLSFIYIMFFLSSFLMLIELNFELKFVADKLSVFIVFIYPAALLFLFSLLIHELSMSNNYNYFILILLLIASLIGNYLLMENTPGSVILSFILLILTIFISSKKLDTHISYTIFSVVGMADNKQRAYYIDSDFLRDSNIILDYKDKNRFKYICSKALVISSKTYVFKLHNKVYDEPNFYQIPRDKVHVYQGEECKS